MFTIHKLFRHIYENSEKYYIETIAEDYAEPGYTKDNEDFPILFANWNDPSTYNKETDKFETTDTFMGRFVKLLERAGYTIEWSDEWCNCSDCNKAFRHSGDSYGWTMYGYTFNDCEPVCGDCILEDPSEYFNQLEGDNGKANTLHHLNPADHGYIKLNTEDYQSGMHGGQLDDPKVIGRNLSALGIERYLFDINSVGQFDMRFSVYVHEDDIEEYQKEHDDDDLPEVDSEASEDPAEIMKAYLKDIPLKSKEEQGDGIQVATMNPDGSANVKIISRQDFIDGKAFDK